MKHHRFFLLLLLLLLTVTACGSSNEAAEITTVPNTASTDVAKTAVQRQSPGSSSFFAINEVGLGPDGYVALTNFTDVQVSLDGLHLCQGRNCFELPDVEVGPEGTARVALGDGAGLDGVVATGPASASYDLPTERSRSTCRKALTTRQQCWSTSNGGRRRTI